MRGEVAHIKLIAAERSYAFFGEVASLEKRQLAFVSKLGAHVKKHFA